MTTESPLADLLGAYLNQDLWDFYPDLMSAVDDFVSDVPERAATLPDEIDRLLATNPSEQELTTLMLKLGAGFTAGDRGYRGWLLGIADRVRRATAG